MERVWRIDTGGDVPVARCVALESVRGLAHGFSLRTASGDERFDVGSAGDESPDVEARRRRFLRAAGFGDAVAGVFRQVHGTAVVRARAGVAPEADGGFWARNDPSEAVPAVRTADCVAIVLADRHGHAAACLHAGWRGTAAGIAERGVRVLAELGVSPGDLLVALGPAILNCCYEVGEEVVAAVATRSGCPPGLAVNAGGAGRMRLDLHLANRIQLEKAGVAPEAIHEAPWCTRCRGDLFFSFRRDGQSAGRQMAAVGPAVDP